MWFIVPLIIIVISVIIISIVISRRLPHASKLKSEIIRRERQARVKWQLVERRLKRKTSHAMRFTQKRMEPMWQSLQEWSKRAYKNALEKEQEYRLQVLKENQKKTEEKHDQNKGQNIQVDELLKEAEAALANNEFDTVEKKCIKAISAHPTYGKIYDLLGKVYMAQESWDQARETYEYLVKLEPARAHVHAMLGEALAHMDEWDLAVESFKLACELDSENAAYFFEWGRANRKLGQKEEAMEHIKRAVELEENNPKYLDFLIEVSILGGNKLLAQNSYDMLKKVNPDNKKLDEFKQRIRQMGRRWDNKK